VLREGNIPRYYTGCPRKGQTENELVGQYQTLNGITVEDGLRADNGGRLLYMMRSTLELRTKNRTKQNSLPKFLTFLGQVLAEVFELSSLQLP